MKKIFYILGVLLSLNSCVKVDYEEDVFEQKEISFDLGENSVVHKAPATRAIVSGTSFTEGNFGVYGYVTPSTYTTGGYLMQNAKFDAVSGTSVDNTYYWPKADNNSNVDVKFVAYYPWASDKTLINEGNFIYYVSAPSENNGTDVLYAITKVHPQTGKVALQFKHALSFIQFQVKKATTVKSVQIKSVQFSSNLYTTGQLVVPMTSGTTQTVSVTNKGDQAEFEFAITDVKDNVTNSYQVLSNIVVIPQNIPSQVTITFDITLTNHDDLNNTDVDITYYNRTVTRNVVPDATDANGVDYIASWDASNKYVYRIYVTPDDVDFTATVVDWTSGDYWQIWDGDASSLDVF